jgi:hypothetical protein
MALLTGELRDLIASATLLSGVCDLEPIRHTYVDRPLRLTADDAARNSPILRLPDELPPLIIARGANETSEFARQHDDFVAACRRPRRLCRGSRGRRPEPLRSAVRRVDPGHRTR